MSKHRVERAISDWGYLDGWLVLDPTGAVITDRPSWREAFDAADRIARGSAMEGLVTERLDRAALEQLGLAGGQHAAAELTTRVLGILTPPWAPGVVLS